MEGGVGLRCPGVWALYGDADLRQLTVEVEGGRPGEEVLLTFMAPKAVLERGPGRSQAGGAGGL